MASLARTAADLDSDSIAPVVIGNCLVTTIHLSSSRRTQRQQRTQAVATATGQGAKGNTAELQLLQSLGLPTVFASSQRTRRKRSQEAEVVAAAEPSHASAHDAASGCWVQSLQPPLPESVSHDNASRTVVLTDPPLTTAYSDEATPKGRSGAALSGSTQITQPDSCWFSCDDITSGQSYYVRCKQTASPGRGTQWTQAQWDPPSLCEGTPLTLPLAWRLSSSPPQSSQHHSLHMRVGPQTGHLPLQPHRQPDEQQQTTNPLDAEQQLRRLSFQSANDEPTLEYHGHQLPQVCQIAHRDTDSQPWQQAHQESQPAKAVPPQFPNDETKPVNQEDGHLQQRKQHGTAPRLAAVRRPDGTWTRGPLPRKLWKYWLQRYILFSRFDEGVLIDEEGWYSVTPEILARHHATRLACRVMFDPFAGVGGNAVQFARTCSMVVAAELSPDRADLIQHNMKLLGATATVRVMCADFWQSITRVEADVVFLSPPWGGPEYQTQQLFSVSPTVGPLEGSLAEVVAACQRSIGALPSQEPPQNDTELRNDSTSSRDPASEAPPAPLNRSGGCDTPCSDQGRSSDQRRNTYEGREAQRRAEGLVRQGQTGFDPDRPQTAGNRRGVAAFLPKNTDLQQLGQLAAEGRQLEVERQFVDGFMKGIVVYFWS